MPVDIARLSDYVPAFPGSGIGTSSPLSTGMMAARPGPERTFHEQVRMLRQASFVSFARLQDSISVWFADDRGMQFHVAAGGFREVQRINDELLALARSPRSSRESIGRLGGELFRLLFGPICTVMDPARLLYLHCGQGLHPTLLSLLRMPDGCLLSERFRSVLAADFPTRNRPGNREGISTDSPFLYMDAMPQGSGGGARDFADRDTPLAKALDDASLSLQVPPLKVLTGGSATSAAFQELAADAQGIHCRVVLSDGAHGPQFRLVQPGDGKRPGEVGKGEAADYLPLTTLGRKSLVRCRLGVFETSMLPGQPAESHHLWQRCRVALHHAGIVNVLLPRWEVDAAVSQCFFASFYGKLLAGTSVDTAFHDAIATVRQQKGWEHPYYWAGFTHSVSHL